MEKDKGLFSFRKHPVGDFLDEKEGRKRKGGRLRQSMGFLMAAALIFNTLPASGFAVSASEQEKGLCEHHPEHTEECGYAEAQPCTHEHGEECYKTVTECVHTHTDECYPETEATEESMGEGSVTTSDAGNREPSLCTHVCSEESDCITKVLDCHHEHDESCGYQEAQECGYVCEICNGTEPENTENNAENDTENAGTDTAECICETLCTEDSINGDCPVCGAEDADLSRCKGEKTEEQEKTGEKVITAWEWIDPEGYLTDGMLALPGAGRENPAFAEDVTALLPEKIQAEVAAVTAAEDGEETEEDAETAPETEDMEINLAGWECASYPEDGAYEGTYTFTAFLPEGFVLAEDAAALEVEVELGGAEMLSATVSADYQEASWNGSEVTYTGKTETCTPVESSADAVTWDAGWYVVNSTVTISEPITVTGAVNLILADGCTLNAEKGIVVTTDNSLTIYAQSGGTGTLNATGGDGAGIGGDGKTNANVDGGSSGAITIHGGNITATSQNGAGIGGGAPWSGANGGSGSNITIYGGSVTASSSRNGMGGAGIGGGGGDKGGGTGENINIYGGTVNATGGNFGAGIGGGGSSAITDSSHKSGDGAVTISGGTVTAVGGNYAAGIGGGGGYYYSNQYASGGCTGGTGSVTITGGIVDASSPTDVYYTDYKGAPIGNGGNTSGSANTTLSDTIVFENGVGTVYGTVTLDKNYTVPDGYTLTIPNGATLSGSGTFSGGGMFIIENLTEDMISVPDIHYTSEDMTEDIKGKVTISGKTICGKTFTVDTDEWTLSVTKVSDMEYTATYTNAENVTVSKTVEILPCLHSDGAALTHHEGKAADCTQTGIMEYWDCSVCGKKFSDQDGQNEITDTEIPIAAHTLTHHEKVDADCTQTGTLEYWECSVCKKIFSDKDGQAEITDIIIPITDHTLIHHAEQGETCTAAGNKEYWDCSICGKKFSDQDGKTEIADADIVIAVKAHTLTHHEGREAGCLTDGNIEYWSCDVCNKLFSDSDGKQEITDTKISAKGHEYGAWESTGNGTHTHSCQRSGCDSTETENCTGGTATYTEKAKCTVCGGEYGELLKDAGAPTGEISIGTNKWNSFWNTITFGLFFKKTEQVTITAQDNESGVASVSYYISDSGLTEDEVKALDSWTAGNTDKTTFNINPDQSCVVYARITDNQGNVKYISSDGMVFDGTSPSITGVTDGETYCTSQTVTVTDDNLESVTVNGKEQALSDSKFTLDVKFDTTPIVITATDKAGNVTTVTVNAGHNYGTDWKSDSNGHWHECAVCGEKSEVLAHTEDNGTVTKPATETEAGTRVYRCSACGYEMRTETIDPIPPTHTHSYGTEWKSDSNNHWHECDCGAKSDSGTHTEDSGTVTKPATETETGTRVYRCNVCGYEMRTEIIEKLPESHKHSYGTEWKSDSNNHWHECSCGEKSDSAAHTEDSGTVTKPATETETGIRTYKCSVCGYEMRTEIIEKLPESHKHSYGTEWKFDSNNHWHECSCGDKSDSAAHTEDSGTVTKPATQTETGIRTYKCSVCGYEIRTEIIEKLPESHKHSYGTEWKFDSNNHWHECSCGEKSGTAAHTWDSGTVTVQPTTDKEGEKTFTCTVCGKTKTETLGKLPPSHKHSYGTEWKFDSNNHWHECSCGEKSGTAAHTWDSGTVTVQPTTDREGEKTYTCTVCGRMKTETLGKLPSTHTHSYGTEWKSDNSNHWHECSCGEKSGTAAHTWNSGTVTVQPTTDREGEKTFTCTVCGRTKTETLGKLPSTHTHSYGAEWKSDNSNHWHECSCGEKSGTAAHTWNSGTVTVQPTTDREGEKTYTCTVCGRTRTETVGKLPPSHKHSYGTEWKSDNSNHWHECSCGEKSGTAAHTWDSGTVTVQPTTDREGEKTFTCTVCGRTRTETLDKLPPSHTENSQPGDKKPDNNSNQPDNKNTGENQPDNPSDGNTEDTEADAKIPFIKDKDGKNGWDVIRTEEEKAEEGSIINIDMNGSAVVPGDIFDSIKGKDITITFDMGNGIIWSVNGKSITTDKADDIDFSVKTGTNAIPVDIVNNITGERYSIQLSLSHEGEFGFTAILSINLGKDNAGLTANLYYYNESTGELEFIFADTVAEDGMVSLAFTHASDYAVVIDADSMEQETGAGSTAEAPKTGEESTSADTTDADVNDDLWNRIWVFAFCGVLVIAGLVIFFVGRKKNSKG